MVSSTAIAMPKLLKRDRVEISHLVLNLGTSRMMSLSFVNEVPSISPSSANVSYFLFVFLIGKCFEMSIDSYNFVDVCQSLRILHG